MKLTELLLPWISRSLPDYELQGLHNDSRQIKPGFLFLAYPGLLTDGRIFISKALEAGAAAVLYEPEQWPSTVAFPSLKNIIPFPDLAAKLPQIASRFYDYPTQHFQVTGVTGTNGKTTIAYQLAQAHHYLGQAAAYIGTLGQGQVGALTPLANTTPDALCLQQLLHQYRQQGIRQIAMEVSSHALDQGRVEEINFQQAIFTNLTHDHLDYHQNMEAYAAAKALLFAKDTLEWAILNKDDPYHEVMQKNIPNNCQLVSYGLQSSAQLRAQKWEISLEGTQLELESPWGCHQFHIKALGYFNISNTLAIFASLLAAGYEPHKVCTIMPQLQAAPGRMEVIAQEPCIIVDYAHTPDALKNVLISLQQLKKGRILVVFGCGGDRDKLKRPMMGKIASEYADVLIITSDNPRFEDPLVIIEAITEGLKPGSCYYKIPAREKAIAKAISLADKNDIILIAGKGHEDYQQIKDARILFSDQQVVRQLLVQ